MRLKFYTLLKKFINTDYKTRLFNNDNEYDPVYTFFYQTSSRNKRRVYSSALRKTQLDQMRIMDKASK